MGKRIKEIVGVLRTYMKLRYDSKLPPETLAIRLRELIEERGFDGSVWATGFTFGDRGPGYNGYAPYIRGTITSSQSGGSRLCAVISLHPVGFIIFACIVALAILTSVRSLGAAAFMLGFFAVVHLLLSVAGFGPVAHRAADLLMAASEAG